MTSLNLSQGPQNLIHSFVGFGMVQTSNGQKNRSVGPTPADRLKNLSVYGDVQYPHSVRLDSPVCHSAGGKMADRKDMLDSSGGPTERRLWVPSLNPVS